MKVRRVLNTPEHILARTRAISAIAIAKKRGRLPYLRGDIRCVDCGNAAQVYDHRDYAKPLDVEPICQRCNRKRGPALAGEFLPIAPPGPFFSSVLKNLANAKGRWVDIAYDTGISVRTIRKIARREIVDPGVLQIIKLANYFREQSAA